MDSTAKEFKRTDSGCNFCDQAKKSLAEIELEKKNLLKVLKSIKGGKYDCLIGLSGGVDSSTVLHYAVKYGLKPLCYSVDNGYNDPRADENILRMVEKLRVPFYRYTIDIKKFQKLQQCFVESGTPNIEIPTDHILMATTYEMASKYGIKWVLSGGNVATESIMPPSWGYNARDLVHIKDIYRKFSGEGLKGLPTCGLLKFNYYKWIKRINLVYLLDYLDYNREESIKMLEREYGYKPYGEKHCESKFTKWFQEEYLPQMGIDKNKAHYSSLINSGQMTREEALKLLKPINKIKEPVDYKKFKNDEKLWNFLGNTIRTLKGLYRKLTKIGKNIRG